MPYGEDIDDMLLASTVNQCVTTEYKNEHHNLQINGDILTSKNSRFSKLTSPSVTSTNDEMFII